MFRTRKNQTNKKKKSKHRKTINQYNTSYKKQRQGRLVMDCRSLDLDTNASDGGTGD